MGYHLKRSFGKFAALKIANLKRKVRECSASLPSEPLALLELGLKLFSILIIVNGFGNLYRLAREPLLDSSISPAAQPFEKPKSPPLEYYLSPLARKRLFKKPEPAIRAIPLAVTKPILPAAPPPPPPPALSELAADLNLVGIINSGNLEAVIFNKKTQKTVYAGEGEFIGDIKIIQVKDSGVILGFGGETLNLNM